jgi:hypothetical protein
MNKVAENKVLFAVRKFTRRNRCVGEVSLETLAEEKNLKRTNSALCRK